MSNRAFFKGQIDGDSADDPRRFANRRLIFTAVALALIIALSVRGTGFAQVPPQTTPSGSAAAQPLAQEAIQLASTGDYEGAISKLRAALEIEPEQHLLRFQLARLLASMGRFEEARAEFGTVVSALPGNSAARRGEITALLLTDRYRDARTKLEEGLSALPRDGQLAHILARLLASAPDDEVRDGEMALRLALSVYEIKQLYETAETLAMAYAETGNFDKALEIQRGLVARAEAEGDGTRQDSLSQRLDSYEKRQPWRALSPVEIATSTEPPKPSDGSSGQ